MILNISKTSKLFRVGSALLIGIFALASFGFNFTSEVRAETLYNVTTKIVKAAKAHPEFDASIVKFDFPAQVAPGKTYKVSMTIKNNGRKPWMAKLQTRLGAVGDKNYFGAIRNDVKVGRRIRPGYEYAFNFDFKVPAKPTPGNYTLQFRMVKELIAWYGDTLEVNINIPQ